MTKLKIGLIFGGKSGEHEVSLISARSIYGALDKNKYDVKLIGIDKKGNWHLGQNKKIWIGKYGVGKLKLNIKLPVITAINEKNKIYLVSVKNGKKLADINVFFPIAHGTFGEDGCLQGFLELLGAAYVGPGVLGSAVGMDKDIMKRLFQYSGLNTAEFVVVKKQDKFNADKIFKKLGRPVFVKPANLGSSVGVSKARNNKELSKAIRNAFQYDNKIIIEEEIKGREIECSVLGNNPPAGGLITSIPGEIKLKKGHYYSYNAKYIDENTAIPVPKADLTQKEIKIIQEAAVKVFETLCCEGMGRVDFFLTPKGKLYANEINTLPGFTSISMYPKMFEQSGIPYPKLLDKLITLAIERKKRNEKLKRSFAT
ncbi:MAG: D-alanine--D-alanine ligase [Candidatus Moranbacteria bacterium]|nr:D-alanine--D-alanine ligase [Candidatus Moranbacteria bacterium]